MKKVKNPVPQTGNFVGKGRSIMLGAPSEVVRYVKNLGDFLEEAKEQKLSLDSSTLESIESNPVVINGTVFEGKLTAELYAALSTLKDIAVIDDTFTVAQIAEKRTRILKHFGVRTVQELTKHEGFYLGWVITKSQIPIDKRETYSRIGIYNIEGAGG